MSIYKGTTLLAGSSISIPLLTSVWQDHKINDISWLCADTFSWQSGNVYTAVYNHLVDDYNNTPSTITAPSGTIYVRDLYRDYYKDSTMTQYYAWYNSEASDYKTVYTTRVFPHIGVTSVYRKSSSTFTNLGEVTAANVFTEIIGDCFIECKVASDGHKIALANQENNVLNNYLMNGISWFYILDTTNTRFKLPRSTVGHGQLIKSQKSGDSWYRLYADGWCEQSIFTNRGSSDTANLLIEMKTADYVINLTSYAQRYSWVTSQSTTHFTYNAADDSSQNNDGTYRWYICGYAASTPENPLTCQYKYLYFYVGQFSQTAITQNAGINTTLFSSKVDLNLNNINPSANAIKSILNWAIPDYSSTTSLTIDNTTRTITEAQGIGYIFVCIQTLGGNTNYLYINEVEFPTYEWNNHNQQVWTPFLVKPGDTYRWYTTGQGGISAKFIPLKGAN